MLQGYDPPLTDPDYWYLRPQLEIDMNIFAITANDNDVPPEFSDDTKCSTFGVNLKPGLPNADFTISDFFGPIRSSVTDADKEDIGVGFVITSSTSGGVDASKCLTCSYMNVLYNDRERGWASDLSIRGYVQWGWEWRFLIIRL